jgi:integrase
MSKDPMLKLLVLCLFKTGSRISEGLSLTKEHFDFNSSDYSIVVRDLIVLKKYRLERDKHGKGIRGTSQSIPTWRTFPILKDELLSKELIDMVKSRKKGLLFHYPHNREAPLTRQLALHRIKPLGEGIGANISNHWFRGQRVGDLKNSYDFRGEPLNEWIGWSGAKKEFERQVDYAKMGWEGLERQLLLGRKRVKEAYS